MNPLSRCDTNHHEYLATYLDDFMIATMDPESIINILTDYCRFKSKGTGPLHYHLGRDYYHEINDILCISPKK